MTFELLYLTLAACLGTHSLFGEGMFLETPGKRLSAWAEAPRHRAKLKVLRQASGLTTEEYDVRMQEVQHRLTWREQLLKPLFTCVGCMSGVYGIAVFMLRCVAGGHDWAAFVEWHWLDGLSAIFMAVFLNPLLWDLRILVTNKKGT